MSDLMTVRIFAEDKQRVEEEFGKPMHVALHKALTGTYRCVHPEGNREYTTAVVNANYPGEALNERDGVRTLAGFRCRTCGVYVFPDPEAD